MRSTSCRDPAAREATMVSKPIQAVLIGIAIWAINTAFRDTETVVSMQTEQFKIERAARYGKLQPIQFDIWGGTMWYLMYFEDHLIDCETLGGDCIEHPFGPVPHQEPGWLSPITPISGDPVGFGALFGEPVTPLPPLMREPIYENDISLREWLESQVPRPANERPRKNIIRCREFDLRLNKTVPAPC